MLTTIMTNEEYIQKLKLYIAKLDSLIAAEVRNLRHKQTILKTEDFNKYQRLLRRRNILLTKCIAEFEKITKIQKKSVDLLL